MPKQSNQKSVTRQWEMLQLVPSHGHGRSAAEICKKLTDLGIPVSKRTVERDLEELSDIFEIDFDDSFPRRWSWNPGQDATIIAMTIPEAVSLRMVEDHLRANLPKALLGTLEGRFRKARKFLKDFDDSNPTKWPERVASVPPVLPMLPPKVPDEILETVQQAVMEGLRLDVVYQSKTSGSTRPLMLHPLGLVQQGIVLYLVATANDHEEPRLFAVHRIKSSVLREDKVIRPRGFTLKDYLRTGALQFGSGELIKLKARVSMQLAGYIAETWLSADQTMTTKGEIVTLSATVQNTWQLRFWILSQGAEITVLQPKSLRESIRTALTEATANYA